MLFRTQQGNVLCHPELLREVAKNGELSNMRLVCKAFREEVNLYVTRLSKVVEGSLIFPNLPEAVSVCGWLTSSVAADF